MFTDLCSYSDHLSDGKYTIAIMDMWDTYDKSLAVALREPTITVYCSKAHSLIIVLKV